MSERLRFLAAGDEALLVELDDLEATLALLDALLSHRPDGVTDVVPAARTVLIRFEPLLTNRDRLEASVVRIDLSLRSDRQGELFEIPVVYDGDDLADVATFLGWSVDEVVRRHTGATFTVAFTGFAPGFAYMTCDDPGFDVPRRRSPRTRIPAGSVAIAGRFGGIYPSDSPGGWQLLGTTPLRMWDTGRARAALLAPGDRVRFRDMRADGQTGLAPEKPVEIPIPRSGLRVSRADRPVLYQDLGRSGMADQGVSGSGALDRAALRDANLCVGNPFDTPVLEIAFGGFALVTDRAATIAVTGAQVALSIRSTDGRTASAPMGRPFALDAGDELSLGVPETGMRSYVALRGGFEVEKLLGSASTDTLAKIGPPPVREGDILVPASSRAGFVDAERSAPRSLPSARATVTLDVVLGPRTDWFTEKGVETLVRQDWRITAETSRVGIRLFGSVPLERRDAKELPSEGTVPGSIQVPHDGQPVVFLADHPLTGGYPVIGVVASYHLDLVGQIPIGACIRFNPIAPFEPHIRETER